MENLLENPVPWLRMASLFEVLTLAVLLGNRITVHNGEVSAAIGPIHGVTYLTVIVLALLVDDLPRRVKGLAWVPVVGGFLALAAIRRRAA